MQLRNTARWGVLVSSLGTGERLRLSACGFCSIIFDYAGFFEGNVKKQFH